MSARVSIIMGIFQCAGTLPETIESILNQTYSDWILIMCDDGSTDNTYQVAEEYAKRYPDKILLLRNQVNMGLHYTLNQCLKCVKTEYIARIDGDDIAFPERLQIQLDYLDEHKNISVLGTGYYYFDGREVWGKWSKETCPTKEDIFNGRSFLHPTVMMRTDAVLKAGGYTVSKLTRRAEDYDLWCKMYSQGLTGANISTVLLKYREDKDSFKKRKFSNRVELFRLKKIWRRKLGVGTIFQCYKPLVVGLIPAFIMRKIRKKRFG